jgi:hypothetical protein
MRRKCLFTNDYVGLYSDGTLGMSDGVGYVGTLDEEETRELYNAMKDYFVRKDDSLSDRRDAASISATGED